MRPRNKKLLFVAGIVAGMLLSHLFIFSGVRRKDVAAVAVASDAVASDSAVAIPSAQSAVYQPYIPDSLTFCGELVPLHLVDVYESLDKEMVVNTYRHAATMSYIKRSHRYFPSIERMLRRERLPDDMKYLCVAESGLENVVSPAGATGFWQLMKGTATERGLHINKEVDERYNLDKSTDVAAAYLRQAKRRFGSWTLSAASYNMGIGGLQKAIDTQQVKSYWDLALNTETARYIYRILAYKIILSSPERYGFVIPDSVCYQPMPVDTFKVDTVIPDLVQFAFDNNINYKLLKLYNPWLLGMSLHKTENDDYKILIPKQRRRAKRVRR